MEKTTQRRALWSVPLTKRYSGDHVKNNEMDDACSTYGREERYINGYGGGPEGKRPLGRPRCRQEINQKNGSSRSGMERKELD